MKKLISLLLAVLLAISLISCGTPQDTTPENPSDSPEGDTPSDLPAGIPTESLLGHRLSLAEGSPFQIALAGSAAPQWNSQIDLNDSTQGSSLLTLSPAQLLYGDGGKMSWEQLLQFGTQKSAIGSYNHSIQKFLIGGDLGVRALGVASGVTDREKDYNNAADRAIELSVAAKNAAIVSMNTYGSTLANIVVKKATQTDAVYEAADVDALKGIVSTLLASGGALTYLEQAYMLYVLGYVASASVQNSLDIGKADNETAWHLIRVMIESENASLSGVKTTLTALGIMLPADLSARIDSFEAVKANVLSAQNKLNKLETKAQYSWEDISSAVLDLANVDAIEVNGYASTDVMQNMNEIMSSMMTNGLTVTTKTGGGVYADIADHCGDYKVDITIAKIPYGGLVLSDVKASMDTVSQAEEPYLVACKSILEAAGKPWGSDTLRESSIGAYVFDFVARTSATNQGLYLQTGDITISDNKITQANSTFAWSSNQLNTATLKSMLDFVRIVIFDTETMTVLASAKPSTRSVYIDGTTVIAGLEFLTTDGAAAPVVTISPNETARLSVLVYIDASVPNNNGITAEMFSYADSFLQLQFSGMRK